VPAVFACTLAGSVVVATVGRPPRDGARVWCGFRGPTVACSQILTQTRCGIFRRIPALT
jgi:hypothetical protein